MTGMTRLMCTLAASSAAALGVFAEPASGHDLLPPAFRGQPGTTFQGWEFSTGRLGRPDAECTWQNPHGVPRARRSGPTMYLQQFAGLQGVMCVVNAGDSLRFHVPNVDDPTMFKTIWVQVVFHSHGGSDIAVSATDSASGAAALPLSSQDLPVPGHPTWTHRTTTFCFLNGCPPAVTVDVTALFDHVDIDQVIIDTACVPDCLDLPAPALPGDFDGDGHPDDADNAPGVANPNQLDCDLDGIGNPSDLWGICPFGSPNEPEACGRDANGGCNSTPPAFHTLACPGQVCGTAWANAGVRDTDWYEITVDDLDGDGKAVVSVELCSALPTVCFLIGANCAILPVEASTEASMDTLGTFSVCVAAPATYWVFVAPGSLAGGVFDGFPCDTVNEYHLATDCFEPCP